MDNTHSLPEPTPHGEVQVPEAMKMPRLDLELELLKADYKQLLSEVYEKRELTLFQEQALSKLKHSIPSLLSILTTLTETKVTLHEEIAALQSDASEKTRQISELKRKMQDQFRKVDLLNVELSEIYASEGWKLLSVYYRFRNFVLPQGSARHQKLKKLVNRVRGKKNDDIVIVDHTKSARNKRNAPVSIDPFEFPLFGNPRVSIVIPAYNGWEMNYLCLRSIWENTEDVSYEVIFADDVSTDETQHVEKYIKNIVHIRNAENLGFLKNAKHAASYARGEYIHFLNNDTEVSPGWLSSLVELMEKDETIGLTGSKLVYPDGRLQEAGGIIWQDGSGWNYGHKQDPEAPEFNYVKEVDYISGASIMIRKALWEKLGGFDERYAPAYYEDTDLAFAVRSEGYKVVYQPLSVVTHYEGFSHGTDQTLSSGQTSIKSYQQINAAKFIEKWKPVLQTQFPNAVNPYWTRDRSTGKKTIVVIDHYVPHFDKDAGSRSTFRMLQLFIDLNYNVKFIGDNFYKHEPYTTHLQQMGIEVLYGAWYRDNWRKWVQQNKEYIDFFYINRPHISIKYIDFIKEATRARIVYFGHDLHFIREQRQYEIEKDPKLLESSERWKNTEGELIGKSDVVLTLSCLEKEIMTKVFGHKHIETMPIFYYDQFREPLNAFDTRRDLLFVGGFNHKPNVDAALWFAHEVFPLITQHLPDIRFNIIGSEPPEKVKALASRSIAVKGYVTDEELAAAYEQTKIVVIPLRFGAGVKGKTVESIYQGIPFVSTSFGIEGLTDISEVTVSQETAREFANAVLRLYNDDHALQEFSRKEIEYAKTHFSRNVAKNVVETVFS